MIKFRKEWSGIRESNPRLDLGKVAYYHYTNPAYRCISLLLLFYSMPVNAGQDPPLNGNPISKLRSERENADTQRIYAALGVNPLRECAPIALPAISFAARRSVRLCRGRYKRAQIARRRDRRPSLASGGVCAACRDEIAWTFQRACVRLFCFSLSWGCFSSRFDSSGCRDCCYANKL